MYNPQFIKYHFILRSLVNKFICRVLPAERTILWLNRVLKLRMMKVFCMYNALGIWAILMHLFGPLELSLHVKSCAEALGTSSSSMAAGTVM